uniref:Pyruvate carboxyltransferase domain-containing protein n=1 Tax=viral metagenome TaxID=1070528 RepID=A0A6C0H651_9ZZZZ
MKYYLFDVSLRDGLQTIKSEHQSLLNTQHKINIYNFIIQNYSPDFIEIGSIVSPKFMPIFNDSIHLLDNIQNNSSFILIPSLSKLKQLKSKNCNLSFITSCSNLFQLKNTNKSIDDTKTEISKMIDFIISNKKICNIKLYISCINHCPISGKIDKNIIINEIFYYYKNHKLITNFCLSDTCGNLSFSVFKEIIDTCLYKYFIPPKFFSLHLHIDKNNITNIQNIFNYAFDNGIIIFDVSIFNDSGGCSMTINDSFPNLDYQTFFSLLDKYTSHKIYV